MALAWLLVLCHSSAFSAALGAAVSFSSDAGLGVSFSSDGSRVESFTTAHAFSQEKITSSNGLIGISFRLAQVDWRSNFLVGLSNTQNNQGEYINHAVYIWGQKLYAYEHGWNQGFAGNVQSGDLVDISIGMQGYMEYKVNRQTRYVSKKPPKMPLHASISAFSQGALVHGLRWIEADGAAPPHSLDDLRRQNGLLNASLAEAQEATRAAEGRCQQLEADRYELANKAQQMSARLQQLERENAELKEQLMESREESKGKEAFAGDKAATLSDSESRVNVGATSASEGQPRASTGGRDVGLKLRLNQLLNDFFLNEEVTVQHVRQEAVELSRKIDHLQAQADDAESLALLLLLMRELPHGILEIGWPNLSVTRWSSNNTSYQAPTAANDDHIKLMQRSSNLHNRVCPDAIPGFAILCITDVKQEFIEKFPLSSWVQQACELHGDPGEKILEGLAEAPKSPNPEKFMYVPDPLVDDVVAVCYHLREFIKWRETRSEGEGGVLARTRRKLGFWPRFRLSKQHQPAPNGTKDAPSKPPTDEHEQGDL